MTARNRRKWLRVRRWALRIGGVLIVTLLGIVGQDLWTQGDTTQKMGAWIAATYGRGAAAVWPHGFYILVLTAVGTAFWIKLSELRKIYYRYEGLRKKPPWSYVRYDKQRRDRWENIGQVRFGHINYPGLLSYDEFNNPRGFGIRMIRELFNSAQFDRDQEYVDVRPSPGRSNWRDVLEQLELGNFDVVATPMLETFERSSMADFTMPMFFSNIGLYISSKAVGAGLDGRDGLKKETLDSLVTKLSRRDDTAVDIYYVPGEISEKQGRKLFDRLTASMKGTVRLVSEGDSIIAMLEQVEAASEVIRMAFCESFHVQIGKNYEGRPYYLTNVLEVYHILYPVCFAVRNGDYVLRNRLNIGLLKMTAEGDGIVQRLSDTLKLNKEAVQAHFVSGWTDPRAREARA